MHYQIEKSHLQGAITVTPSKSHTMRAILFAALADGTSLIRHALPSPDTTALITACKAFGAEFSNYGTDQLSIKGTAGKLHTPQQIIDVGNSGQVLRFCAAVAATIPFYTILTGDASICSIRPMNPLINALTQLGAFAVSSKNDGHAPIIIKGSAAAGKVTMDGHDSQPVSAMLILSSLLDGMTTINVTNPGEQPWIEMTLYWLSKFGVAVTNNNFCEYTVIGPVKYHCFEYTVPGDWSSAAFPIAAALVTNSTFTVRNMDYTDPQGDKAIIDIFQQMGATIHYNEQTKEVNILPHTGLHGIKININAVIDAVPILATVACFATSPTVITGAEIARHKECDRLAAITEGLRTMGAKIEEFDDGLCIYPSTLHSGVTLESRHDHRVAMALSVAGLQCGGIIVKDTACVAKSFPGFAKAMQDVGAKIHETNT